ncbi:hypothetical protein [Candidatus Sulfurimonas baltica]|uniref:Thioredoxin-like fold domain-containing protein n=1 Tax=Candidatus Sulfurimonas baltica TaxID=2740404 RepID=A0A7S7LTS3_9BACT|nr:hypothetical protein [Candidatus Sulfurimonas baltica]QOY51172.1 hypothetical protein HUE88_08510 [Candidatus Sulfurimonas baltica]
MKLFYIVLLCFNLFANEHKADEKTSLSFLDSISKYEINIGSGSDSDIYVFVDPLCSLSQKYITKIYEDKSLQLQNTYHIFLLELTRFESIEFIQYIYQSENPKSTLLEIMLNNNTFIDFDEFEANEKTLQIIDDISKFAKSLNIKLRPYLIFFDRDAKFCRDSEGVAPCLANEFNE